MSDKGLPDPWRLCGLCKVGHMEPAPDKRGPATGCRITVERCSYCGAEVHYQGLGAIRVERPAGEAGAQGGAVMAAPCPHCDGGHGSPEWVPRAVVIQQAVQGEGLALENWAVYRNPLDYPGRFVVRRWVIVPGLPLQSDPEPLAVVDTLEAARAAIPPGLCCLPAWEDDDPVIVEVWL